MHKAFSIIELVFVIVIIGILASIAIPKLATTRDDALDTRGMTILSSVRNALAMERQKRIMSGNYDPIDDLTCTTGKVFDCVDGNSSVPLLEYPPKSCSDPGCWSGDNTIYTYKAGDGSTCTFTLSNNRLTTSGCAALGE